jgi:hypothetical protein
MEVLGVEASKKIDHIHDINFDGVPMLAVLAAQLGTPRGRSNEHSGKFPSIVKPRFNQPVGERNNF